MRLRATYVVEYDVPDDPKAQKAAYGTTDPAVMAEVDRAAMDDDPGVLLSLAEEGSIEKLTVEVVR
jgi:hypothetical protein